MRPSPFTLSLLLAIVAPAYSKPFFTSIGQRGLPNACGGYPFIPGPMARPAPCEHPILTPVSPAFGPVPAISVPPAVRTGPAPAVAVVAPVAPSSPVFPISQGPTQPVAYGQPEYSQPIFNRPVITEVQKVVRRPVIVEVQEVVHKPYLTGYQPTVKLPKYTTPLVQQADYPAIFNAEHYYPSSNGQTFGPHPQFVQPGASDIFLPSGRPQTGSQTSIQSVPVAPVPGQLTPVVSAQPFPGVSAQPFPGVSAQPVPVVSAQPVPVAPATGSVIPPIVPTYPCPPVITYDCAGYGKKYGYH